MTFSLAELVENKIVIYLSQFFSIFSTPLFKLLFTVNKNLNHQSLSNELFVEINFS